MAGPPVLIKKYGNRRLYDTGDSKYVTLDELAAKIRSGADVRVVDAQTGEDLTQALLTQIVLETGNAAKFLPVQLLLQMIRLSDDSLAEFFSRYVTGALDIYLQAKRGVQSLASYAPVAQIPMAATDALARLWMGTPFGGYPQGAPPPYGYAQSQAPYVAPPPPPEPEPEPESEPRSERSSHRNIAVERNGRAPTARPDREDRSDRNGRASTARPDRDDRDERDPRDDRDDDVAAMRRELDELKQVIREGLSARAPTRPSKRKKP